MIVEGAILGAFTVGETDTGWLLDVEDVSLEVPRELARVELRAARLDPERAVLLHEAEHRGATWTTIEPDEERSVVGVVLGLEEQIMDFLRGVGDIKIAGESSILVEGSHLGQRVDAVRFVFGRDSGGHNGSGEFHL